MMVLLTVILGGCVYSIYLSIYLSPSVAQKTEGSLVAYIANVCIRGGTYPPNQNRKKSPYCIGVSEDYRKMAMTKVYSTGGWIPWGCLIILTKNVWNLWGGTLLKTMKNVCKQGCADLWLQNIQSASHSRNIFCVSFKPKWLRTVTARALNIEEGYALTSHPSRIWWKWRKPKSSKSFQTCVPQTTDQATQNVWKGLGLKFVYFFCRATFWGLPGESLRTHQT